MPNEPTISYLIMMPNDSTSPLTIIKCSMIVNDYATLTGSSGEPDKAGAGGGLYVSSDMCEPWELISPVLLGDSCSQELLLQVAVLARNLCRRLASCSSSVNHIQEVSCQRREITKQFLFMFQTVDTFEMYKTRCNKTCCPTFKKISHQNKKHKACR